MEARGNDMSRGMSTKADETAEFIEFWNMWRPHARQTDGRGEARDGFLKHVRNGADPHDIVAGAAHFLRSLKDKNFIPMASVWINRRAYEDLAETERDYQHRMQERSSQTNVVALNVSLPKHHFLRQQVK